MQGLHYFMHRSIKQHRHIFHAVMHRCHATVGAWVWNEEGHKRLSVIPTEVGIQINTYLDSGFRRNDR